MTRGLKLQSTSQTELKSESELLLVLETETELNSELRLNGVLYYL